MSKTIRQIADEIGVSKQAVQKRITREPLCTSLMPHIHIEVSTKYIDSIGENLIKSAFDETIKPIDMGTDTSMDKIVGLLEETLKTLQIQLSEKDKQLAVKDGQIEDLNARLAEVTAALTVEQQNAAAAQALHGGTIHQQLLTANSGTDGDESHFSEPVVQSDGETPAKPKKRGFFKFGKNKRKK